MASLRFIPGILSEAHVGGSLEVLCLAGCEVSLTAGTKLAAELRHTASKPASQNAL